GVTLAAFGFISHFPFPLSSNIPPVSTSFPFHLHGNYQPVPASAIMSQQLETLQAPRFKASDLDHIHPTADHFTVYSDRDSANTRSQYCWSWRYFIEFSEEAVRRLHEQEVKIQSLEAELERSRAVVSSNSSTQTLSLPTATTSTISITPISAGVGTSTTQTTIQVSATPSHQTISIVTPTSSTISISHENSDVVSLVQKGLEERFKNLEDSINKLTIATPPATETPPSPTAGPGTSTVTSIAVRTDTGLTTGTPLSITNTETTTPIASSRTTPPISPRVTPITPEVKAPKQPGRFACTRCGEAFHTRAEFSSHLSSDPSFGYTSRACL
ncbi:hypothetical protein QBC40DRAFT_321081, partial [Triangularia verruculosa]